MKKHIVFRDIATNEEHEVIGNREINFEMADAKKLAEIMKTLSWMCEKYDFAQLDISTNSVFIHTNATDELPMLIFESKLNSAVKAGEESDEYTYVETLDF